MSLDKFLIACEKRIRAESIAMLSFTNNVCDNVSLNKADMQ